MPDLRGLGDIFRGTRMTKKSTTSRCLRTVELSWCEGYIAKEYCSTEICIFSANPFSRRRRLGRRCCGCLRTYYVPSLRHEKGLWIRTYPQRTDEEVAGLGCHTTPPIAPIILLARVEKPNTHLNHFVYSSQILGPRRHISFKTRRKTLR